MVNHIKYKANVYFSLLFSFEEKKIAENKFSVWDSLTR